MKSTDLVPPNQPCDGPNGPYHMPPNQHQQCGYCLTPYVQVPAGATVVDHGYQPGGNDLCQHTVSGRFCGYTADEHRRMLTVTDGTTVWTPTGGRPSIGQYRVTVLITGDAIGPEILSWLVADRLNSMAGGSITGRVEQVETLRARQ